MSTAQGTDRIIVVVLVAIANAVAAWMGLGTRKPTESTRPSHKREASHNDDRHEQLSD